IPVVRFAAFGPSPGTYGPRCGTGIEGSSSDVFRITAPADWVYRGTSGGSGADDISFDLNGTRVTVDLYADRGELRIETDFEDRGPTGLTVELPGASVPLHEVFVGGRTGYGILYVPWLVDLPAADDPEGTILITSREPGLVDPETAAAVLGTVRVDRCAAISRTLIWGPMSRRQLVPDFEGGDPLGKTRPDEPHPEYVPGESPLLTFSEAQVAFLLPVPAEVADCVAGLVREDAPSDPILHMKVLLPSGTMKEELEAYVAQCSA
ncbi:MAG: hypothetical protein KJP18_09625, partial [Gemmatimonadetes bacterium]|nr:hypothetical protein [Gemmatimonadota bacterium]